METYIQLMIKGVAADAERQLDARGFHPSDRLTPITEHNSTSTNAFTLVRVKVECEPGVIRWYNEPPSFAPFPAGTLLHFTAAREPLFRIEQNDGTLIEAALASRVAARAQHLANLRGTHVYYRPAPDADYVGVGPRQSQSFCPYRERGLECRNAGPDGICHCNS